MIPKAEPQRIGETSAEKRGGTGTRRQASPDPRTPHSPKAKVQGVRW
jgi:hypothetical protein